MTTKVDVNSAFESYVDELGSYLEHNGFSDTEIDTYFLEHHGVKGMKWGVRRGRGKTGVSRSSGALIDRNERLKSKIDAARSGKKYGRQVALGKALVGEKKQKENWKRMVKDLDEQTARLKSGKTNGLDKLDKFGSVSLLDLAVSRRPR